MDYQRREVEPRPVFALQHMTGDDFFLMNRGNGHATHVRARAEPPRPGTVNGNRLADEYLALPATFNDLEVGQIVRIKIHVNSLLNDVRLVALADSVDLSETGGKVQLHSIKVRCVQSPDWQQLHPEFDPMEPGPADATTLQRAIEIRARQARYRAEPGWRGPGSGTGYV
ncbi:hypothetical protein [Streptomyces sp. BH105]|uniref:hypothetical protein n=1 Tax=Streptomyces sp. BH105 TaxID=3410408 RepID=UPI003CEEB682